VSEATVETIRTEAVRASRQDAAGEQPSRLIPPLPRHLALLWLAFAIATAGFLAVGSIVVRAGDWIDQPLRVRDVWSRFLRYLVDQGASPALVVVVAAAATIALLGAAYALWLALALEDQQPVPASDDAPGR
jgi:hypothetical protein